MPFSELEEFAKTGKRAPKAPAQPKSVEPAKTETQTAIPATETTPEAVKNADGTVEAVNGLGETITFKNMDEFKKSYTHAQAYITTQKKTIDTLNAKMGELGTVKQQLDAAKKELAQLKRQSHAPAATAQQKQEVKGLQADLSAIQKKAAAPNVDPNVQIAYEQQIQVLRDEMAAKLAELEEKVTLKDRQAAAENLVNKVYSGVEGFQKKVPSLATKMPFSKIDDIVVSAGSADDPYVATQVSPTDLAAYKQLMSLVEMQYPKDENGYFLLDNPRFEDLSEAFLVHQHRTGTLGQQTATAVAEAQKKGQQSVEEALAKGAAAVRALPAAAPAAKDDMSPEMITRIFEDQAKNPYEFKNNPAKRALFIQAATKTGIPNPEAMLG